MAADAPGDGRRWLGIGHVQLAMPVGEEARARTFYGDLLGLTELPKPPVLAARGGCWFAVGNGQQLHLGVEAPFAPARKAHPCLLAADLPSLRERLEGSGVAVIDDELRPGMARFYCVDPFGNRLEFADREGE